MQIARLQQEYAAGRTIASVLQHVTDRIARHGKSPVWITLIDEPAVQARAAELHRQRDAGAKLPLFGIPFAVKDNIDVAGLPTTAACPAFAFTSTQTAESVRRLEAAGAIVIGKTNLDQFATGLVGTRSPYGICTSVFSEAHVSGGSSSGSAVAVAAGLVSFSLGTDTAGSGRVPAAFNNIVGLKPSKGLISTTGVFPACRTLDCVCIFAATAEDATLVLQSAAGFDATDPFSRMSPLEPASFPTANVRIGIPKNALPDDTHAQILHAARIARLRDLGGQPLNRELTSRGARLLRTTHSAPGYKLYALAGTTPAGHRHRHPGRPHHRQRLRVRTRSLAQRDRHYSLWRLACMARAVGMRQRQDWGSSACPPKPPGISSNVPDPGDGRKIPLWLHRCLAMREAAPRT